MASREATARAPGGAALRVPGRLELACSWPVVRRALGYLVVVGAILIAINHGDALLRGDVDRGRWVKLLLTPLVPYVVSTLSSVGAIRARAQAAAPTVGHTEASGSPPAAGPR